MSRVQKRRLAAVVLYALVLTRCGETYRPTIIPNPVPVPDPSNFHAAFAVNTNGYMTQQQCLTNVTTACVSPGSGLQVDVSGDSNVGVTKVGIGPAHAALQPPNGTRVWVANTLSDSVSVFSEANTGASIGTAITVNLAAGSEPVFVYSTEASTMYVANSGNVPPAGTGTVAAISTVSNVVTDTIPVGMTPIALSETPDGKKLYVVNRDSNTVTVVNTVDRTINVTLPVGTSPRWVIARNDNARVYVLSHDGTLTTINAVPSVDQVLGSISVGAGVESFYYDRRLNRLYIPYPTTSTVGIYDVNNDPPAHLATIDLTAAIPGGNPPCPATGCAPQSVAPLPDGSRAYIASFYLDSNSANCTQVVGQAPVPCIQAQVTVISTLNNGVTTVVPLPEIPVSSVGQCNSVRFRISAVAAADSSHVYVATCDGGGVSSIKTSGNKYVVTLPTPFSTFPPVQTCTPGQTCPSPSAPPRQNTVFLVPGP